MGSPADEDGGVRVRWGCLFLWFLPCAFTADSHWVPISLEPLSKVWSLLLFFPLQPTNGNGFQLSLASGRFAIPSWFSLSLVPPLLIVHSLNDLQISQFEFAICWNPDWSHGERRICSVCCSDQGKIYRLEQDLDIWVEVQHYSGYRACPRASDYIRHGQEFKIKTRYNDGEAHSLLRVWRAKLMSGRMVGVCVCAREAREKRKISKRYLVSSYYKPNTVIGTGEGVMSKTHCLYLPRVY